MSEWFYAANNRPEGPVSEATFIELVRAGTITASTLVWKAGMPDWKSYGEVWASQQQTPDPRMESGSAGVSVPAASGYSLAPGMGGASRAMSIHYGGFWIRFLAFLLDALLKMPFHLGVAAVFHMLGFSVVMMNGWDFTSAQENIAQTQAAVMATMATLVPLILAQVGFEMLYSTFFLGRFSATPGMMVCGVKVIRPEGEKLTYGRAFGRYWASKLTDLTFFIGYIIIGFDPQKRALHDYLADTRVVYDQQR